MITISKPEITAALAKITSIVENRNAIPILSNVAITAMKSGLTISATDMDINAIVQCNAVVKSECSFTIPARQFFDICKKASDEEITVSVDSGRASIKSGRSKFQLGTLPIEDFPEFKVHQGNGFELDGSYLLKLIEDTTVSMSDEETRYYLCGIYLHHADGNLVTVATNGNTLSQSHGDAIEEFPPVIIPRKAVGILQKLLSGYAGKVTVFINDNKIQFNIDNLVLVSKVVDGTFPDYQRVIPREFKHSFLVDTQAAIKAADRLCTIEDKTTNSLKLTASKGLLTMERYGTDENASDDVDCDYQGDDFTWHLNSAYLMDALNKIGTGKTVVKFNDAGSAFLFLAENDDSASWLVMPCRGNGA